MKFNKTRRTFKEKTSFRKFEEEWRNDDHGVVYYYERRKLSSSSGSHGPQGNDNDVKRKTGCKICEVTLQEGSLLKMCFRFIAININLLESLVGFPEIIGKDLFTFMIENKILQLKEVPFSKSSTQEENIKLQCLKVFNEAFQDTVLSSLSLCSLKSSIGLSSFLECFDGLCKLDLSGNLLDDATLSMFSNLPKLTSLILMDCGLNNSSIQKFTLPYRMFEEKPKGIQILDISYNNELSCSCLKSLKVFKALKYLNLSNTLIQRDDIGLKFLEENKWKIEVTQKEFYNPLTTEGWATEIIQDILDPNKSNNGKKASKKLIQFYGESTKNQIMAPLKKQINKNFLMLVRDSSYCLNDGESEPTVSKPKQRCTVSWSKRRFESENADDENSVMHQYKKTKVDEPVIKGNLFENLYR